jgi:hypothetical protein
MGGGAFSPDCASSPLFQQRKENRMSYVWLETDLAGLEDSVAALVALPQPLTGGNKRTATELKARMNARGWSNLTDEASVQRIKAALIKIESMA